MTGGQAGQFQQFSTQRPNYAQFSGQPGLGGGVNPYWRTPFSGVQSNPYWKPAPVAFPQQPVIPQVQFPVAAPAPAPVQPLGIQAIPANQWSMGGPNWENYSTGGT